MMVSAMWKGVEAFVWVPAEYGFRSAHMPLLPLGHAVPMSMVPTLNNHYVRHFSTP